MKDNSLFTIKEGIEIQTRGLERWKKILLPEAFDKLKKFATKDNHEAETGFDISRGSDLTKFVVNL